MSRINNELKVTSIIIALTIITLIIFTGFEIIQHVEIQMLKDKVIELQEIIDSIEKNGIILS